VAAKKILIVEDDKDLLLGLQIRLEASGYSVVTSETVYDAVNAARKEMPDLIILDLGLPGGDGYKVMDRLQELAPIPIIIFSARDPISTKERVRQAGGAFAFFQKPTDNEVILAAIAKALRRPGEIAA